jgi:hypothetical protein
VEGGAGGFVGAVRLLHVAEAVQQTPQQRPSPGAAARLSLARLPTQVWGSRRYAGMAGRSVWKSDKMMSHRDKRVHLQPKTAPRLSRAHTWCDFRWNQTTPVTPANEVTTSIRGRLATRSSPQGIDPSACCRDVRVGRRKTYLGDEENARLTLC